MDIPKMAKMNKPPIMFYSVQVYDEYDIPEEFCYEYSIICGKKKDCSLCNKPLKGKYTCLIRFIYYDYPKKTRFDYAYEICGNCLNSKIKDKTLKDLKIFIPLLKIKGNIWEVASYDISVSELEKPTGGVFSEYTSFYKVFIPNEEKEEYYEKAKYYKTGKIPVFRMMYEKN